MTALQSRNLAYAIALGVPATLIAAVYVAQYGFYLAPCEMCWWQRYAHFAAIALAAIGWALRGKGSAGDSVIIAAGATILAAGLIGGFHAGVEYHWWQGLTACSSTRITGDPLAAIMDSPLVRCDTAAWTLFGVSLAGYNFLVSTVTAFAVFILLARGHAALPARKVPA